MRTLGRLRRHLSAALFTAALVLPTAIGAFALADTPAYAQSVMLTSAQNSAILDALKNCTTACMVKTEKALSSGMSKPFSSGISKSSSSAASSAYSTSQAISHIPATQWPLLTQMLQKGLLASNGDCSAVESAIAQAVQYGIAQYGSDSAAAITSATIVYAEQEGISPDVIGIGLALAAADISPNNAGIAATIASTVANQGLPCEVLAFKDAAGVLGNTPVVKIADTTPSPPDEQGGGCSLLTCGGGWFPPSYPDGGGGCLNPSCTKL